MKVPEADHWCRRWDSNPHEVALTGFFESDKNCGMMRDAALRGVLMSLFAFLCVMVRVRVRPDCHQNSHQKHLDETWLVTGGRRLIPVLGSVRPWTGLEKLDSGCGTDYLAKIA